MKISRKILQACFFTILAHAHLLATTEGLKPNIIFILTDDQSYGDLGYFDAKNIATPNIDRLCKEGMKFTSFYVTNRCSPIHFSASSE